MWEKIRIHYKGENPIGKRYSPQENKQPQGTGQELYTPPQAKRSDTLYWSKQSSPTF